MTVGVYIDGFNFYYGIFSNKWRSSKVPVAHKWLDMVALCDCLLPNMDVAYVGYFTAYVKPHGTDLGQQQRQRRYLRALQSLDRLEVVPGAFRKVQHKGTLDKAMSGQKQTFWHFEEKQSDVNLCAYMVRDAALNKYDEFVAITNDSDLAGAIKMITTELAKPVHVLSPDVTENGALTRVATSSTIIDTTRFAGCLLPDPVILPNGTRVDKPIEWS